ncbi:hypothetical protein LK533_12325 [Sphingomonas sp. PL-96]|nr:hypothetical protein [Sphingomonas sp. PL-96]
MLRMMMPVAIGEAHPLVEEAAGVLHRMRHYPSVQTRAEGVPMPFELLLVVMAQQANVDAALARYREATRAEYRCEPTADTNEVVVCALRDADHYRVPILEPTPGDPKIVDAIAERERLVKVIPITCGLSTSFEGCGMFGATATVSSRGVGVSRPRPIAP